jgi:hypothetical protein
MHESLKNVLESVSPSMKKAVTEMYELLIEGAMNTPTSSDAVEHLQATVGVNPNEVKDGTKIVGLAGKVGMDGESSLAKDEDQLLNQVSNDMAAIQPIDVQLPKEDQFENLPTGGGQTVEPPAEEPVDLAQLEEGGDDEMTWDEIQNAPPSIPEGTSDEDLAGLLDG